MILITFLTIFQILFKQVISQRDCQNIPGLGSPINAITLQMINLEELLNPQNNSSEVLLIFFKSNLTGSYLFRFIFVTKTDKETLYIGVITKVNIEEAQKINPKHQIYQFIQSQDIDDVKRQIGVYSNEILIPYNCPELKNDFQNKLIPFTKKSTLSQLNQKELDLWSQYQEVLKRAKNNTQSRNQNFIEQDVQNIQKQQNDFTQQQTNFVQDSSNNQKDNIEQTQNNQNNIQQPNIQRQVNNSQQQYPTIQRNSNLQRPIVRIQQPQIRQQIQNNEKDRINQNIQQKQQNDNNNFPFRQSQIANNQQQPIIYVIQSNGNQVQQQSPNQRDNKSNQNPQNQNNQRQTNEQQLRNQQSARQQNTDRLQRDKSQYYTSFPFQ